MVIWNTSYKNASFKFETSNQCFLLLLYQLSGPAICFGFSCLSDKSLSYYLVASILRQFWMILSPNKKWRKIYFLSWLRHCDWLSIVVLIYNFQIWNKKEYIIIIIIIIIIIPSLEIFTSTLADGSSLESEWQQVSSSFLKSPRLFLVFWPFSTMLSFGWSPLVCHVHLGWCNG